MFKKTIIYILACCPSKIEQILYSKERHEDLIALKAPFEVNDDLNLNEKLRVSKGISLLLDLRRDR